MSVQSKEAATMSGSQQLFYRAIVKTIILYSIGSDQQAAELTCGDQKTSALAIAFLGIKKGRAIW
jgi:hypothetical protein